MEIKVKVNGVDYKLDIKNDLRLIDLLREELKLTGTKEGCGEGECGACTVLLNGDVVNSCLVMAFQVDNKEIITIEGLSNENEIHPIQKAFLEGGAVQCGFCTPGMVLSAKAILDKNPKPSKEEIKESISGNLCRCTGYNKIVDSILLASELLRSGEKNE